MSDTIITIVPGDIEIVPLETSPAEILFDTGNGSIEIQYFGTEAMQVEIQGLGPAGPAGPRGATGVLKEQLSTDIKHPDGIAWPQEFIGEWPLDRRFAGSGSLTKIFAEIMSGTGSVDLALAVDNQPVTSIMTVSAAAPLDVAINLTLAQGSNPSLMIAAVTGDVRWLWFKAYGSDA